jgi:hypothetical protein
MKNFIFMILCYSFCGYAQNSDAKFRFNLSGGMAYDVTGSSGDEKSMIDFGFDPQKVKDATNDFRLGLQGNADIHYLFNEYFGIGAKYSFYINGVELSKSVNIPAASGYEGGDMKITERDYVNYIGPSLHFRSLLRNPAFAVSATLSGGYTYFRGEMKYINANPFPGFIYSQTIPVIAYKGKFGTYNGVGLEYFFKEKLAIGFDLNYLYTSFDRMHFKSYFFNSHTPVDLDLKLDEAAVISRFDFSIGIKVYL